MLKIVKNLEIFKFIVTNLKICLLERMLHALFLHLCGDAFNDADYFFQTMVWIEGEGNKSDRAALETTRRDDVT